MNRRKDMIANLKSKVSQMSSTLTSHSGNRDSLLGPEISKAYAMGRTGGLDNYGLVGLQRQFMKEQDEGLDRLEETVVSTKHIALAVNEELTLHTRLIDDLDEHVDVDSRLRRVLLSSFEQTHKGWLLLHDSEGISERELKDLKEQLSDACPGNAVATFLDAILDKALRTVALHAARGRGKSAALIYCCRVFKYLCNCTEPRELKDLVCKGLDALDYR
ncbi:hypothetical protein ACLB2K_029401 [Fragaria x ananassa]